MTKFTALVFGIAIVLAGFSRAEAHHDALEGLLIGGAGGAAIGHVIAGTPEGVIVGSFLGGTIGMLVAAENHPDHVVVIREHHRPHSHWPGHSYRGHRHNRDDRHYYGRHGHKHHRDRWDRWDDHRGRHHRW